MPSRSTGIFAACGSGGLCWTNWRPRPPARLGRQGEAGCLRGGVGHVSPVREAYGGTEKPAPGGDHELPVVPVGLSVALPSSRLPSCSAFTTMVLHRRTQDPLELRTTSPRPPRGVTETEEFGRPPSPLREGPVPPGRVATQGHRDTLNLSGAVTVHAESGRLRNLGSIPAIHNASVRTPDRRNPCTLNLSAPIPQFHAESIS